MSTKRLSIHFYAYENTVIEPLIEVIKIHKDNAELEKYY